MNSEKNAYIKPYEVYTINKTKINYEDPILIISFRLKLSVLNKNYKYSVIKYENDEKNIIVHENIELFDNGNQVVHIKDPVVILDYAQSYSHFLVDILGKLFYIKKYFPDVKPFYVIPDNNQENEAYKKQVHTFNDILSLLNLDYYKIDLTNNHKKFIFNKVYSIAPETEYDYQRFKNSYQTFTKIKEIFAPKRKPLYNKNIFIPRKEYYSKRIGNLSKLESILTENNYEIVFLEDLSLQEQINLFYDAKNIIAVTGTSLVNMIFANENTNILSMHSEDGYSTGEFSVMAKFNNINYTEVYLQNYNIENVLNIFNLLKKN